MQLKAKGLKLTPQRLAIIDVLVEKQDIISARLSMRKQGKERNYELSTTYATLHEFTRWVSSKHCSLIPWRTLRRMWKPPQPDCDAVAKSSTIGYLLYPTSRRLRRKPAFWSRTQGWSVMGIAGTVKEILKKMEKQI